MNDLEQCNSELEHDHHSVYGKSLQCWSGRFWHSSHVHGTGNL